MTKTVALCADQTCLVHPELLGLPDENLEAQEWIELFTSAGLMRAELRQRPDIREAWVVSDQEVSAINLAAALKRDCPERVVRMLAQQESGSLLSRSRAAGIDHAMTHQAFVELYRKEKQRHLAQVTPLAKEEMLQDSASVQSGKDLGASVERSTAGQAYVLTIASGSGGAGKSTVSLLTAVIAARQGRKTLLIDFDLQFGDMRDLMGVEDALGVDELMDEPTKVEGLSPTSAGPALLAAPKRIERSEELDKQVPQLLALVSPFFDVIVVNAGNAWTEGHISLIERSSKVLFLVDQRASSLRACKHAFDLCMRCGVAASPFVFAVNRCAKNALFTSIDVSCAMQGNHTVELRDGGADVEDALCAHMPNELIESRNGLCVSLEQALEEFLPEASGSRCESVEKKGFFGMLRKKRAR